MSKRSRTKTVGIVTFQHSNYGTKLQNFALCQALLGIGVNPVTIVRFDPEERLRRMAWRILSCLHLSPKHSVWRLELAKEKIFRHFDKRLNQKRYLKVDSIKGREYDLVVSGSDQVWNPTALKKPSDFDFYFLRFIAKAKRCAYAPSFGSGNIPDSLSSKYRTYINEFSKVSIREKEGQKIIKTLTGLNVPVMPDPTFLLSKDQWGLLAGTQTVSSKDYLFVYFLSAQSRKMQAQIRRYARDKKLQIISASEYMEGIESNALSPDEFIAAVSGAKAVITDSFHGAVFSIIMNTPFIVARRTDVDQFSRVETLLDKYHFESALFEDGMDISGVLSNEKFHESNKIIEDERKKGITFLRKDILGL